MKAFRPTISEELHSQSITMFVFTLFVFACIKWCPTHIVLCFSFVFLHLVCPVLPVSLDWPFWLPLRCSLMFIFNCTKTLKFHKIVKSKWRDNMINYQSYYQIWKLSDQRLQRSCIHKVKSDGRTNKQMNRQTNKQLRQERMIRPSSTFIQYL